MADEFITVEQLQTYMGTTFTEAQSGQAHAIIAATSVAIESITGCSFSPVSNDLITAQADGWGIIELTEKPIRDVSSVIKWDEEDEDSGWKWDGMAAIYSLVPKTTYNIVYSYGYSSVPTDIQTVCLGSCARSMYNPAGLRQETVGAISVTYGSLNTETGTINFSNFEEKILAKYTDTEWSYRQGVMALRERNLPILTTSNFIN